MIYISHRGNINGKNIEMENTPEYIDAAINSGYDVEIDIWAHGDRLFLGHDCGHSEIDIEFLNKRIYSLWIHCKNYKSVEFLRDKDFNWFWHDQDDMTLTKRGYIWVYPGKQPINKSIAVLPEIYNDDVSKCIGICSDYIERYRNEGFQTRNNQISQ